MELQQRDENLEWEVAKEWKISDTSIYLVITLRLYIQGSLQALDLQVSSLEEGHDKEIGEVVSEIPTKTGLQEERK